MRKIIIQIDDNVRVEDAMRGIQLSHIYQNDGAVVSFKGVLLNARKFNNGITEVTAIRDKEEK